MSEREITTLQWVARAKPKTFGELAQRSVDNARTKLECAQVELDGALERQRLIVEHGKADQPIVGETD